MNQDPSDKILNNMVAFIEQHGREEVERIKKSMGDEFTIEKNAYVDEEKNKIAQSY
jgi:vacuolar-type H+-ATPase subunit E/Vma4